MFLLLLLNLFLCISWLLGVLVATDNHTCTACDGMSVTAPYVLVDLHLKRL